MLTNKDYCDYDTAIALSELGFPLKRMKVKNFINGQFSDSIVTVLLYEAQKWLREEKELYVFVGREWENAYYYWLSEKIKDKTEGITHSFYHPNKEGQFSSYEEALSEGIKEAVKILKDGIGE